MGKRILKKELEEINLNLLEVIESIHQMSYKITTVLSSHKHLNWRFKHKYK